MSTASSETKTKMNPTHKKLLHEAIAVAAGLIVMFLPPPTGLTQQSMQVIGLLLWAIINWILLPMPEHVTALIMCSMWVILKIVTFGEAFAQFSGTTVWLVIGVLGIGAAVTKCGLLTRIALLTMKLFPATFRGQVMALLGAGTVVAPLIPSTTAKISIVGPMVSAMGQELGLEKRSKGMGGLMVAMYTGFCLTGPVFLSASFFGYIILAALPPEVQMQFGWGQWFVAVIPWAIVMLVLSYFAITRMYKPATKAELSKEMIKKKLADLGPMKREEKITLIVLFVAIVFWVLERTINIPAVIPALLALSILTATGVFTAQDYATKIPWHIITFIGGIMAAASVLAKVGVNDWIAQTFGPFMGNLTSSPYIFIPIVAVFIFLARFVVVDIVMPLTLFTVLLTPFCVSAGMSPWVCGFMVYVMNMVWAVKFQNPNYLIGFTAAGGEETIGFAQTAKYSLVYVVIAIIGLVVSIPYWQLLGIIH